MTTDTKSSIPKAKSGIASIKAHMVGIAADAGPKITIALDSNENAFGPSPKALEAATRAASHLERYLENPASILVPALASCYQLEPENIAIGFGSVMCWRVLPAPIGTGHLAVEARIAI